jgi:hypothetical protein
MAVFSSAAVKEFENRVVAHLKRCFRHELDSLGEPKVRELVQYGLRRAASYGIRTRRDVCRYIDLMIVFGGDFDKDPRLPWASGVLNDGELQDPTKKLLRLHEAATDYLRSGATVDGGRKA